MTSNQKKTLIRNYVKYMIKDSEKAMRENLEKVLTSGCIDIDTWDNENSPMLLPKAIMCAMLEHEVGQYTVPKTIPSYKAWLKEKRNISYFI